MQFMKFFGVALCTLCVTRALAFTSASIPLPPAPPNQAQGTWPGSRGAFADAGGQAVVTDSFAARLAMSGAFAAGPTLGQVRFTPPTGAGPGWLPSFDQARMGSLLGAEFIFNATWTENFSIGASGPRVDRVVFNRSISVGYKTSQGWAPDDSTVAFSSASMCPTASGCAASLTTAQTFTFGNLDRIVPGSDTGLQLRVQAAISPVGGSASGNWAWNGTGSLTYKYLPKTWQQYAHDAVKRNAGTAAPNSSLLASNAYEDVYQTIREFGAGSSATNIPARDAEYYLRGYSGGAILRSLFSGNLPEVYVEGVSLTALVANLAYDVGGPVGGLASYNQWKRIKQALGQNMSGSDRLPASPPGGNDANRIGYERARNGMALDPLSLVPEPPLLPRGDSTALVSLSGTVIDLFASLPAPTSRKLELTVFDLNVGAAGFAYQVELTSRASYVLEAHFNSFLNLMVADLPGLPSTFDLYVNGVRYALLKGEAFDFSLLAAGGATEFELMNSSPNANNNQPLVLLLQFTSTGVATVNALGYSEALTPVPELPTLLLFVGGLVVLRLRAGGICYPGKASL